MSMDPNDENKWEQYLKRYCMPHDFCPIYNDLNNLKGKTKRSKEF